MNYSQLLTVSLAPNLPAQYCDRIAVTAYQDESGFVVWHDISGTYTDNKGIRWACVANNCVVHRSVINAALDQMRDELDFEFCIKSERITIRG